MSSSLTLTPGVISYLQAANRPEHAVMERCRAETERDHAESVGMMISPEQGAFLSFLVRVLNARDAIELGVFTGYSSMAVALTMRERHGSDARLVACDVNAATMTRANEYFREAGVDDVVEPRVGDALASLEHLLDSGENNGFDFIFVDADKAGYPSYYEPVLALLRTGGLAVFDNMLWGGAVAEPSRTDADTVALRQLAETAKADERVDMALTSIGDGLLVCMKR